MVSVKGNVGIILFGYQYRNRLTELVLQVNSLANGQVFRTRQLGNRHGEDSLRISLTVCFCRQQMDVNLSANLQVCNSCIKAFNHLACAANKFQRLATIIGRIKLLAVIKGTFIVYATGFSYITSG